MSTDRTIFRLGKATGWAGVVATMILLAEVVWMVLPFVGFISLHVTMDPFFRFRRRWFGPFFMRSYHPLGAPLALVGMGIFFSGAIQIYGRKLRGGGAVTGGLYRWVRHPQYASLAVVGLGLLLLWPRYYLALAFVTMCFLYVALARAEERQMLKEAGETYRSYMARTSMFFPGDRRIVRVGSPGPATWAGVARGFFSWIVAMALAFAAAFGLSTLTILNRHLPLVEAHGFVALDRAVFSLGSLPRGLTVAEFFGKNAVERRLRRHLRSKERLTKALGLLEEDGHVDALRRTVPPPATFMVMPWEPDRPMFREEAPCADSPDRVLRLYVVAAAAPGNPELPPRRAFDGYLADKEIKLVASALVDLAEGRVRQVVRLSAERAFLDAWDRTLDKSTF